MRSGMAHHEMSERARSGEHNAGDGAEAEPAAERRVWVRRAALVVVLATVAVAVGAGGRQRRLRIDLGERRAFADKMGALHSVAAMHSGSLHDSMMLAAANVTDDNRTVGEAEEGFISGVDGSCLQPPHLHAYFVNQLFWTWVHTLEVSGVTVGEDGKEKTIPLGHVKSQPFSFVAEQTWRDDDGKVIAEAHQDAISTVTNTYVDDCAKKLIATVSEQLAPSSSAVSQYTIQNKDGDIVAVSTMSRNFGTEVDINDQTSGKRLVTVSKGWGQFTDAWSATFREGQAQTLANEPRVIVMLLAAASSAGSWGLGGPLAIMLNPLWLLLLFCCCCAGMTAYARARETQYDEIPAANAGGPFFGQGYTTGYGTGGGTFGGTQYV